MTRRVLLIAATLAVAACQRSTPASPTPSSTPALGELRVVGTIEFPTTCDPSVQSDFTRGVALLHSFFYAEARRIFEGVAQRDPQCAMAHWGVAMTWYHPIWAPPSEEEFAAGRAAIDQARAVGTTSEREQAYIEALAAFYETEAPDVQGPDAQAQVGQGCHGPTDHLARSLAWKTAMEQVYRAYPEDIEAAVFYALSLLGSAPAVDPELAHQLAAAEILERLWEDHRNHPGVAHYLIHAYDYPSLAYRGLDAARTFAEIAPWVPHALHMPSHIFTRLGLWRESIASNQASADAARAYEAQYHPGAASFEELHALDYLEYAYLQIAEIGAARAVVERVQEIERMVPENDFAAAYAVGAIPARFALERHAWAEAASLPIPPRPIWEAFPFAEAHLELAHAIGRARLGDRDGALEALERMRGLRDAVTDRRFEYFQQHLDAQIDAVSAWVAFLEGDEDEAVELARRAADAEDRLGKHPVSPGPVYPLRELLAELLLELDRPKVALTEFQRALAISPARLNALLGAGQAAVEAGKPNVARGYYQQALAQTSSADGRQQELARARAFVGE